LLKLNKFNYTKSELNKVWNLINIKKNDNIYITGNISFLGKMKETDICKNFYQSLKKAIGNKGSIFFPTHTWSLISKKIPFCVETSKSESGVLTEYLRKQKNSVRQMHPFASVSCIGPCANLIKKSNNIHAYGKGSPFEKIIKLNSKFISIGLKPNFTCSQIHQIEFEKNVPYRYIKEFKKKINYKNKIIEKKFCLHVLYKNIKLKHRDNNEKIFKNFLKYNKIYSAKIGKGQIYSYDLNSFYKVTSKLMDQNIYCWLKSIPKIKPWTK